MDKAIETTTMPLQAMMALTKPRIVHMSLIVALGSMGLAMVHFNVSLHIKFVIHLIGLACLVGGASALNMVLEIDTDALMERTAGRPLPQGVLSQRQAWILGLALSVMGLGVLAAANILTFVLGVISLVTYVGIYTPMKRVSALSLIVGAVPGAMPAWMGYTMVAGHVDWLGFMLFLVLFFWQLPHFWAIGVYRGDEYRRAGLVIWDERSHFSQIRSCIFGGTLLTGALASQLVWVADMGLIPQALTIIAAIAFSLSAASGYFTETPKKWARRYFFSTLVFITVFYLLFFGALLFSWL